MLKAISLVLPPSDDAITARYPGEWEKVDVEEYKKALELANKVYDWSAALISKAVTTVR